MGRPGLTRHRKFKRLARALEDVTSPGFGELLARGSLETLWDAVYESGEEYLGDTHDVEALAGWHGPAGVLTAALLGAGGGEGCRGFIEEVEGKAGKFRVHDLWDHAPDYVRKRRSRESERRTKGAALASESGRCPVGDQSATGQEPPDGGQCPPNGRPRAPAPAPALQKRSRRVGIGGGLPAEASSGSPEAYPLTAAVLAVCLERGWAAAWPAEKTAPRVEAAIKTVGITAAVDRLMAMVERSRAAGGDPEKPWLGWHIETIAKGVPKPRTHGDLGSEIHPWPLRLTEAEVRAYREERLAIAPSLADAPIGIVGPERELVDLNAKWKAIAEDRA